ncbi:hypothetical protein JCM8547_005580 [Rhodosporidiobolus lusitaniae]
MLPHGVRTSLAAPNSPGPGSPRAQQVSSAADLTAAVRRTTGERPPPLVGCSVTLIRDAVYVFGGRLVPTRTMVSTLYRLDLRTLVWTCLWSTPSSPTSPTAAAPETPTASSSSASPSSSPLASSNAPQARYFHSACAWGDKLVIFGGEGYEPTPSESSSSPSAPVGEDGAPVPALRTLDDLCIWDTKEGRWVESETKCKEGVERPAPRYAHLGVVTSALTEGREKSVMLIMGGQDIRNTYLHSTNVLDLETLTWEHAGTWDRHIGTYRAVCTAPTYTVVPPSVLPVEKNHEKLGLEDGEQLVQLGYSEKPKGEKPEPLLLFSNFNFTQVRRDLDLLASPLSSSPFSPTSLSSSMAGPSLPPGLRFPTGTIIGRHLLVFGTFLSHAVNNFSIWALDLGSGGAGGVKEKIERGEKLEWTRIDPGSTLVRGSWNRALAWGNSVVVLGDRERDIAADYDHRQTNFTHLALIDLESFGIYQPPPRPLPPAAQQFGLQSLAQPFLSDFEIVCSDGKRLGCSRKILVERWSWFASKMEEFKQRASGVQSAQQKRDADAAAMEEGQEKAADDTTTTEEGATKPSTEELRLTPRTLNLPEPSPVVQAFLQYLYTLSLSTPLQLHPPVLAALVVFAKTYGDAALRGACVHALHGVLERESAVAPLVYEATTLAGCTALQIRALKTMLSPSMRARASQPPSQSGSGEGFVGDSAGSAPYSSSSSASRFGVPTSTFSYSRSGRPSNIGTARTASAAPRSPRSPHQGPPSSPPPTTPLPITPTLPSSPSPQTIATPPLPLESPADRRHALKPRSDTVAEPTPDEVPPLPVPLFFPFAPLEPALSPPALSRTRSVKSTSTSSSREDGYFDVLSGLLSDEGEESDGSHTATDSLLSSPTRTVRSTTSTRATSVRSRSSSVGSHRSGKESHGPLNHSGWHTSLPTQVEEEEPVSPEREEEQRSPTLSATTSSTGHSFVAVSVGSSREEGAIPPPHPPLTSPSLVSVLSHRPIPRLSLPPSLKSRSRSKRRVSEGEVPAKEKEKEKKHEVSLDEHWAPSFFDTVKGGQGSVRNPLSTRKATSLTPELLAGIDLDAVAAAEALPATTVSAPLAVPSGLVGAETAAFETPRPAPRPSTADAASTSTASLVPPSSLSPSSLDHRRHSLDPAALRFFSPRPPRSPLHRPSPLSSSPSLSPSVRSLTSSASSTGLDRRPSSSGGSSVSVEDPASPMLAAAQVNPVGLDVLVFDPAANETVPLLPVPTQTSSLSSDGLPRAKSPVFLEVDEFGQRRPSLPPSFPHGASTASLALSIAPAPSTIHGRSSSSLASSSFSSNPPRSSKLFSSLSSKPSSSPSSSSLTPKQHRQALELSLGTRILTAAGASETEIRLRARSVGFQVLKKHEEEVKKAKRAGREPPKGLGAGLTGAEGEYVGGAELVSKFSWD